jgi:hypothetical protein
MFWRLPTEQSAIGPSIETDQREREADRLRLFIRLLCRVRIEQHNSS